MSTPPAHKIAIDVSEKYLTDALLITHEGTRTLCLRPQTFSSAVRNLLNVMPGLPHEAAERMIREQCPELRDFDDLLGLTEPAPPSVEHPPAPTPQPEPAEESGKVMSRRRRRRAVLATALLPALAASWALGRYTNVVDTANVGQARASTPDAGTDDVSPKAPFADSRFETFTGSSNIDCETTSTLAAECTDSDGVVMSTKAATGPDSTIFLFSYGSERIGLRIFYDAAYARTWARQDGTQQLYPDLHLHGRYALWGTDHQRIEDYAKLLVEADRVKSGRMTAMGAATPLPPRLAALTLGTLGLDSQQVHQLIARPAVAMSNDAPAIVAARLVLGLDTATTWSEQQDDIVALAAGIGPSLPPGQTAPAVVPAMEPADTKTTAPRPDPAPPASPSPSSPAPAQPSSPDPAPRPAPTTTPTSEPSTPAPAPSQPETPIASPPAQPTPPASPAPSPPETPPPAQGTPAPPGEETPAPPAQENPAPPATPAPDEEPAEQTPAPPGEETPVRTADGTAVPSDSADQDDDLLILDSAWTVAA
ncbi:hypothetical protein [Streptomyces similanensis]|uniref:Uncharacterized protein n=1 Tax=Streptomyces similanensis TaxID=1274988 RepID=A0ABP9L7M3_9ACTN